MNSPCVLVEAADLAPVVHYLLSRGVGWDDCGNYDLSEHFANVVSAMVEHERSARYWAQREAEEAAKAKAENEGGDK